MAKVENDIFRVATDGFFGELFLPEKDQYPGKARLDSLTKTLEFVSKW